jgi:hypothetical protein
LNFQSRVFSLLWYLFSPVGSQLDEHSEQARAPHTNGPRAEGRAPEWGSEFTTKAATRNTGGFILIRAQILCMWALVKLFPAPAFWFKRYLIVVPRPLFAAALVVRRRYLAVAPGRCVDIEGAPSSRISQKRNEHVARGAARCALQVFDRGAQAVARGGARCSSQGCIHLSWCPGRCPRRCSLRVKGT